MGLHCEPNGDAEEAKHLLVQATDRLPFCFPIEAREASLEILSDLQIFLLARLCLLPQVVLHVLSQLERTVQAVFRHSLEGIGVLGRVRQRPELHDAPGTSDEANFHGGTKVATFKDSSGPGDRFFARVMMTELASTLRTPATEGPPLGCGRTLSVTNDDNCPQLTGRSSTTQSQAEALLGKLRNSGGFRGRAPWPAPENQGPGPALWCIARHRPWVCGREQSENLKRDAGDLEMPAPTSHQPHRQLAPHLQGNNCDPANAPTDHKLS
ncbi:hypothetical protein ABZ613_28995 [Streptomyces collinus]|uniref:hypothetical protein n=1 Tax=Streptomyces collinus TaxID=42684 RepID=UPI00340AD0EA